MFQGDAVDQELPEDEQILIRNASLEALFRSTGNLQKQFCHTVYLIGKVNY